MIRRVCLYIAHVFCEGRANAALRAHHRWMRRAEKLFRKIGGK